MDEKEAGDISDLHGSHQSCGLRSSSAGQVRSLVRIQDLIVSLIPSNYISIYMIDPQKQDKRRKSSEKLYLDTIDATLSVQFNQRGGKLVVR